MNQRIRVTARHREPVDLDRLAAALLAVVADLDPKTRARLAKRGQRRLDALDQGGSEDAA